MSADYITMTIPKRKRIALIAHDAKKEELIKWCEDNRDILSQHELCGTGTTARMITDRTNLQVKGYNSGPLGGDQHPLTAAPHDPDVKALLRIAQVYDIPMANNKATADFMIQSKLMDETYDHQVINFQKNIDNRANALGK